MNEDYHARRAAEEAKARKKKAIAIAAFVVVALAIVLVATVFGGGTGGTGAVQPRIDGEAIQVTDSTGRTVEMPKDPQAIAVFDSFSGELAVLAGAGPKLTGVPAGTKSDEILQMIYPELESITSMSGNAINLETQVASEVDVAIVKSTMNDDQCKKLDAMGIPYIKVGYTDVPEQIEAIRLVGSVCGPEASEKAEAIASYYQQTVDMVGERVSELSDGEKVRVYHSINDALMTDSSESLGASWIGLTGCIDVSGEQAATSDSDYDATLEQIYRWNPDLVICNVAQTADDIRTDAAWSGMPVVREGKVLNIPIGATRWGQRGSVETWFAMLWLGCQAYPELFSDIDFEQTVKDAYADLYGVEVDDALYTQMLEGSLRTSNGGGGNGSGGGGGGNNN